MTGSREATGSLAFGVVGVRPVHRANAFLAVSIRRRPSGVILSRVRERSGRLLDLDGLPCRYPVPGEQFLNAGLRMIRHSGDDVGEPGVGIDVVEATGLDEGIHGGGAPTAAVGACERPVASSDCHGPQHALGGVVGHADPAIVEEAGEAVPAAEHVVDGLGEITLA